MYKQNKDLFIFSLHFFFVRLSFSHPTHARNAQYNAWIPHVFFALSTLPFALFLCSLGEYVCVVCIILNLYATFIYVSLVVFMYKVIIFRVRWERRFFILFIMKKRADSIYWLDSVFVSCLFFWVFFFFSLAYRDSVDAGQSSKHFKVNFARLKV